ncbi:MAG: hypothetical protein HW380_3602 [Magnetococcales bacterium]|nr:hypothetical protein [Magnetococcales bacterium]
MTTVTIPAWNILGVLPPIDSDLPTSPNRSPYPVSLKDVVMRFSTSPERRKVLAGFLDYRKELHRIGLTSGFQWLDGSFLEDVETIEKRDPRDIDVVTFLHTPNSFSVPDEDAKFLDSEIVKERFRVDAYVVELDAVTSRELTLWSAYWYSMWSHRRNQAWKGFLQIELAPEEDEGVRIMLSQYDGAGGEL